MIKEDSFESSSGTENKKGKKKKTVWVIHSQSMEEELKVKFTILENYSMC